jgi:hypothetical protein
VEGEVEGVDEIEEASGSGFGGRGGAGGRPIGMMGPLVGKWDARRASDERIPSSLQMEELKGLTSDSDDDEERNLVDLPGTRTRTGTGCSRLS